MSVSTNTLVSASQFIQGLATYVPSELKNKATQIYELVKKETSEIMEWKREGNKLQEGMHGVNKLMSLGFVATGAVCGAVAFSGMIMPALLGGFTTIAIDKIGDDYKWDPALKKALGYTTIALTAIVSIAAISSTTAGIAIGLTCVGVAIHRMTPEDRHVN